ncbi:DUF3592 domain-containing protein [Nocardiopsis gilva]|uniref:DUF3592 domain-containing protein n=1 Tax=Nocardiopsis gilva TaxID=280236 RepID=UPI000362F9DF
MSDLDPGSVLIWGLIAAVIAYNLVKSIFARLRRQRLQHRGVSTEAVVAAVGPLHPPRRLEHPFTLRFRDSSGAEYTSEHARGFGGIVPVAGWRVPIRFDPSDPSNVEITHNPYLHPIPGAPQPRRESRIRSTVHRALFVAIVVAVLALGLFGDALGDAENVVFGGLFVVAGFLALISGIWFAGETNRLRRSPGRALATVTHSWDEPAGSNTHRNVDTSSPSPKGWVNAFTVLFDLPDGRQVHRRSPVATSTTRYEPGQRVEVAYDPSDPTSIWVGTGRSSIVPLVVGIGIGVLFIVVGLAIAVFWPT